ncbi:hypothetical protein [Desulfospira joergensenii]|uniref:hypothetical protein n=1 Tax=Desulfospira joergensenii TaxID=53329 RepID=UPI0003B7B15B|nr:hypothetical protein [Desulfospira joergensenii]
MNMNIDGNTFNSLSLYADLTDDAQDNEKLEALQNMILAAAPDATPEQVGQAIDDAIAQAKAENPDSPVNMEEIFETAVKSLNSECTDEAVTNIKNAWQEFTGINNLNQDDIGQILVSPFSFVATDEDASVATIQNTLALLVLLMIEIAGEESANQLLEGFDQKDTIMALAKEKAAKLREKAWVNFGFGLAAAGSQALGGLSQMIGSGVGLGGVSEKAAKSWAGLGQGAGSLGQAGSTTCNAIAGLWTGLIDADIAEIEGKSQVASINKDTADKLKAKAEELIKTMINLLQTIAQAKHGVLTSIKV